MSNPISRPWRPDGHTAELRSVTLPVDAELLATAKAMNIDLATTLDAALRSTIAVRADQALGEVANCNTAITDTSSHW